MKLVILDAQTMGTAEELAHFNTLGLVRSFQSTAPSDRVKNIADAEIVITNKVVISAEIIDACPNIRLICITATGTNNVDLAHAAQKGVQVKNVAGYSTNSVAQHTFAMVLQLMQQCNTYNAYVQNGDYAKSDSFTLLTPPYQELKGKTWGIIGFGAIGQKVAEIASAFGCNVIYYSTSGKNNQQDYQQNTLEELLNQSDIVSIHAPLNEATLHLIGEHELQMMKSTSILINVGRGGIVDESALACALDQRVISGAGVDVFENEPILADNPLLNILDKSSLVMTPHVAWASVQARETLLKLTAKNIEEYLDKIQ